MEGFPQNVAETLELRSLLIVGLISLWIFWLWSRKDWYKFSLQFPGALGAPILGILYTLKGFDDIADCLSRLFQKFRAHTFCVWMGLSPMIMTDEPEFIRKVLSSSELLHKGNVYEGICIVLNGGFMATPVEKWRRTRKLINPSFHHGVLVSLFPHFNKAKTSAIRKLESLTDDNEHDVMSILLRNTTELAFETTMGKAMQEGDQIDEDFIHLIYYGLRKIVLCAVLSTLNLGRIAFWDRKFRREQPRFFNFVKQLIDERLSKMTASTTTDQTLSDSESTIRKTPRIFIDQAVELYRRQQFDMNDITADSIVIVIAALETSSFAIFSTLALLAMNPEVQERLFNEIVSLFPEKSFEMELHHLEHLPYLDMVLNEALRLMPPVPFVIRQAVNDTQLDESLIIPKGMQIMISIYHLHRRKDIWGPNANQFDPDHFLPSNLTDKHSHAFIPFSKGARNCIGWRYADFAMKTLIAGLVRNYRFSTSFKFKDLRIPLNLTAKNKDAPKLKIEHRQ